MPPPMRLPHVNVGPCTRPFTGRRRIRRLQHLLLIAAGRHDAGIGIQHRKVIQPDVAAIGERLIMIEPCSSAPEPIGAFDDGRRRQRVVHRSRRHSNEGEAVERIVETGIEPGVTFTVARCPALVVRRNLDDCCQSTRTVG